MLWPILGMMNEYRAFRFGQLLIKVGSVSIGVLFALLGTLRDLFAAADSRTQDDRSLLDSDLIGDYNFRTQQFDSGNDPAGWYEDEP